MIISLEEYKKKKLKALYIKQLVTLYGRISSPAIVKEPFSKIKH